MKHDNNMKDYSGGRLITITATIQTIYSDRANTQSVTVRKVVKTATQLLQCPCN